MSQNPFFRQNGLSEFVRFLADRQVNSDDRIPPLTDLSKLLGVSVAALREQMEVARSLGYIAVSPKKGIHRLPYTFTPAVLQSLNYAVTLQPDNFVAFSDLRKKLEVAYWKEAVHFLDVEDRKRLLDLVEQAEQKINRQPVMVPQKEHRELHLLIYKRVSNVFVYGLLEAFWEIYETHGLHLYDDQTYLKKIWEYHRKMVEAILTEDYQTGFQYFCEHLDLMALRKTPPKNQNFE